MYLVDYTLNLIILVYNKFIFHLIKNINVFSRNAYSINIGLHFVYKIKLIFEIILFDKTNLNIYILKKTLNFKFFFRTASLDKNIFVC